MNLAGKEKDKEICEDARLEVAEDQTKYKQEAAKTPPFIAGDTAASDTGRRSVKTHRFSR